MLTKVDVYGYPATPLELLLESEDSPIQIKDIQGIGPVKANIARTAMSQYEIVTGTSQGARNIVFTLGLNPDFLNNSYESLRTLIYQYFMPQGPVRLRFQSTHMNEVEIIGVVEGCEPNVFSQDPEYQVSIICPQPNFQGITQRGMFGFTTAAGGGTNWSYVDYAGTLPTGFLLEITSNTTVPSYTGQFRFTTDRPYNDFYFDGTVDSSRKSQLSTKLGEKFVRVLTPSTGLRRSRLSSVPNGTKWPVLLPGQTNVQVRAGAAGMLYTISYFEQYGGL